MPLRVCTHCGSPLSSGAFGLRCARCVLSLGAERDDDEDAADHVAELFPELHLEGQVARGGFGAVYRAEHRRMKRPVALKFLDTVLARSPEAVALFGQEMNTVDDRADIYALGATLRRMLTGQPVREGVSEQTLMLRMKVIITTPVAPIAGLRPDLPVALAQLCDAMLALDPNDRPASAAEVARRIEPWCAGAELPRLLSDGPLPEKPLPLPKRSRGGWWAAAGLVALSAVGATIYKVGREAAVSEPEGAKAWNYVFSDQYAKAREVDEMNMARLFSADWEHADEAIEGNLGTCARLALDGRIVRIDSGQGSTPARRPSCRSLSLTDEAFPP